ncbi:hypothetical protein HDU86_004895 [Geranomyces michiganensis]|nr:hypothetical protein HDU86_004895 [Geranomyces michiganensis]
MSVRPSTDSVGPPVEKAPFAGNPTHGLVPLSATEIFLVRLGGWATLVRRLITQFEMIVEHHKRLAEAYGKCARDFAVPVQTKDGDNVFGRHETCQFLFGNIQSSHIKAAQENSEAGAMLETHVVPNLRALLVDLRRKAADSDKEWVSLDRELGRDKDLYVKLAAQLKSALARHYGEASDTSDKDPTIDPWAANISLKRHIATCVLKQDHYRAVLLAQQEHFATFEATIVQTLRVTLSAFFDWQKKDLDASQDIFKKLKATLHTLDAGKDWESFRVRHADRIIEKDLPTLKETDIDYEGRQDALIALHKEGMLLRKDTGMKFGFRKQWKETLVVVTSANYLHALPPTFSQSATSLSSSSLGEGEETGPSKNDPELSLYLPDCVVGPLMMNEKEPEEFVVQQKAGGMFGGEKKHKFKGADMDQSAMWWAYLSERVRMSQPRPKLAAPAPASAQPLPRTSTSSGPRSSLEGRHTNHAGATASGSKPQEARRNAAQQPVPAVPAVSSAPVVALGAQSQLPSSPRPPVHRPGDAKPQYHDEDGDDFEIGGQQTPLPQSHPTSDDEDNHGPLHQIRPPSVSTRFNTADPSISLAQQMEAALSSKTVDADTSGGQNSSVSVDANGSFADFASPHGHTDAEMWSSPVADFKWEAPPKPVGVGVGLGGMVDEDEMGTGAWA